RGRAGVRGTAPASLRRALRRLVAASHLAAVVGHPAPRHRGALRRRRRRAVRRLLPVPHTRFHPTDRQARSCRPAPATRGGPRGHATRAPRAAARAWQHVGSEFAAAPPPPPPQPPPRPPPPQSPPPPLP